MTVQGLHLHIEEQSGIQRVNEPVTVGIPFPRGMIFHPNELSLFDRRNRPMPLQTQALARWPDNSIKWALLDFQANVGAKESVQYWLQPATGTETPVQHEGIVIQQSSSVVIVRTGPGEFFLDTQICKPFSRVVVHGVEIIDDRESRIVLIDEKGREHEPEIRSIAVEAAGPLRATLNVQGHLKAKQGSVFADFVTRLSFYRQSSLVELKFTIRNPRAARHPGGFWDLGDEGSIYFRDLSVHTALATRNRMRLEWMTRPGQQPAYGSCAKFAVYQDSSGGQNWQSSNHVNRFGKVTTTFRGYRVTIDDVRVEEGERVTPVVSLSAPEQSITGTIASFWQNFPKAVETYSNCLSIRLFPQQYSDLHELQGGEQKTHTVFFHFGKGQGTPLSWVHDRLIPRPSPEWYASSKALGYIVLRTPYGNAVDPIAIADRLVDVAITGDNSFFDRREVIDEYGWRHFGDLYADHEAVQHEDDRPLVAHYNNQYDVIHGAIVQYARSGDVRWFRLADDLAKHVIDIDIYHTQEDRPAFNGGLFWHTEHYTDAATATHRAYSRANIGNRNPYLCGGGPSNEHNYTTGLLLYYYLTGDMEARKAVLELANWVINLDSSAKNTLARFDRRPTGMCSSTANRSYHGPGRGCGNSISTLIDAYLLTREEKYLAKAEQLIQRCIHPKDNVEKRNLSDIERRWSYTVFLQVLGKYLDVKAEEEKIDYMYSYARESLLHYAHWMLENEIPYKQVLDKVEIPTETWPAQDIRKSNVFDYAAKHATGRLHELFLQKSEFFFNACVADLLSFRTWALTRPVVLLMTNAFMHNYFRVHPDETAPQPGHSYDFGQPKKFTPQLGEIYQAREKMLTYWGIVRTAGQRIAASLAIFSANLGGDRG